MSRTLPFKLLLSALLLLPAIGLEAQKPDPVAWETSVESMGEDVYLLRIEARIEAPWHIYDTGPYEGGPNPTTISFESNPDAELIGGIAEPAPPRRVRDELFGMEIGTYASKAVFTQRVRLKKTGRHYAGRLPSNGWPATKALSAARRADSDVHDTRSLGRTDSGRARRRGIGADGDKA